MNTNTATIKQSFFPLNTVLFPGGVLPLQIFEQRYLNLVSDCMKNEHGFVTVLINKGNEVGDKPEIYQIGTYTEIIDWESLDSGLLGIKAKGVHTVQILDTTAKDDGLIVGHTRTLEEPAGMHARLSEEHVDIIETLREFSKHPFVAERYPDIDFTSAPDVCFRLSELLPVPNIVKQDLLETRDINQLLIKLQAIINQLGG